MSTKISPFVAMSAVAPASIVLTVAAAEDVAETPLFTIRAGDHRGLTSGDPRSAIILPESGYRPNLDA